MGRWTNSISTVGPSSKPRPCAPPEDLSGALDAEREDFGLNEPSSLHQHSADAVGWLESHGL